MLRWLRCARGADAGLNAEAHQGQLGDVRQAYRDLTTDAEFVRPGGIYITDVPPISAASLFQTGPWCRIVFYLNDLI